ncbi:integrase core domain-containing protein [Hirsutella rhossiliensis]|uniref:Integrase core domain-containing protein n=1 Tax=Hirsutella rhossiliensis TaxID=111463 RepID=A0A9P8SMJ1_9HYPO|nr:integrase core domain-containing protein [Hirsutella rhossiliensis]KAH0966186.1 integrase core domain-containing protein [Hirsutella rhossiliensis]
MSHKEDSEVFLDTPYDWINWQSNFVAKAIDRELWDWIDGKKDLMKRPERVALEPPPTLNAAEEGPAASAATTSTETASATVFASTTRPASVAERDRRLREKQFEYTIYQSDLRLFGQQQEGIRDLRSWVAKTICKTYHRTCCKANQSLKQWYELLNSNAKGSEKEVRRTLHQKYEKAITPTAKPPRNWTNWSDIWIKAINEGLEGGLPEALNEEIWLRGFLRAVRPHFPHWVDTITITNPQDQPNFTIHKLKDLFLAYIYNNSGPSIIKRGAFGPTFNARGNHQRGRGGKRPRSKTTDDKGEKYCRLCEQPGHRLNFCWGIFPDRAAEWWKPSDIIKKNLKDESIAEEIKRAKGKRQERATPGDFLWAGESKVPIQGYGDVDVEVEGPQGPRLLRLTDAAYCESFACNLISYKHLKRQGVWWDESPGQRSCLRAADRRILAFVQEEHGSITKRHPQTATAELWHLRLGHPGPRTLEHLVNCSRGVRIKGITTTGCDDCGTAKLKRQIRREPRETPPPGERLAVDFHDLEPDQLGYDSMMLITDRATGFAWDYYLQDRRAETINASLGHAIDYLRHQYGFSVKVIECDNELTSQKPAVTNFLLQKLLKVEPSAPYTQAQNGGAERSGGVIKDKARAMGGELPTQLWREIYRAAVYLNNRTPKSGQKWKSPYENVTGKKPPLEHLRAYGCKAFAMTTTAQKKAERLKKLNPRAWIGYLVGYTSSNVYRVWVPTENKVISTRDVIFDERQLFDGTFQTLAQDVKDADLEELAEALRQITLPEEEEIPSLTSTQAPDERLFELNDDANDEQTPPVALLAASIQQASHVWNKPLSRDPGNGLVDSSTAFAQEPPSRG